MPPFRSIGPVAIAFAACLAPSIAASQSQSIVLPQPQPAPAGAGTILVGPQGSGAHFDDLQAALDAAPPDALVLVAAGQWSAIEITKPVRIVGKGSNATTIQAAGDAAATPDELPPTGSPAVIVRGIGPGKGVTLAGFRLLAAPGPTVALLVEDCTGPVRVVDVTHYPQFPVTTPLKPAPQDAGLATVRRSLDVHLQSCRFAGWTASMQSVVAGDGLHGIALSDSNVTLVDCTLRGNGAIGGFGTPSVGRAGAAIHASHSELRLSRTYARGGDGGIALFAATAGAPAMRTEWSAAAVTGGPGAALVGGNGKSNAGWNGLVLQPGGASLDALGGQVFVAKDVALEPGMGGDGVVANAIASAAALVQQLPWVVPTTVAAPSLAGLGAPVSLRISGAPLTPVWPWYGPALASPLPVTGALLPFQLDPVTAMPLGIWMIGASGSLQLQLTLPSGPGLIGLAVGVQAIGLAGGAPQASVPAILVIGG